MGISRTEFPQLDRCVQSNRINSRKYSPTTTPPSPPLESHNMPAVGVMDSTPAVTVKEAAKSGAVLEGLIKTLAISKGQDEASTAAGDIATLLNGPTDETSVPAK